MIKKRIIFTLLYFDGFYVLSRNFRLQKVGNIEWLKQNYNFKKTALSLDELIILNVRPSSQNFNIFCEQVKEISRDCFIPISAGGGIRNLDDAKKLLKNGADKIVLNSIIYSDRSTVIDIAKNLGKQCLVGSVDFKKENSIYNVYINSGEKKIKNNLQNYIQRIEDLPIGEIYLNSIDNDGTGQGLDLNALDNIPENFNLPLIIAGGVGNWKHIYKGLFEKRVDAVSTANLFNFVNDGLYNARNNIFDSGINIPIWSK